VIGSAEYPRNPPLSRDVRPDALDRHLTCLELRVAEEDRAMTCPRCHAELPRPEEARDERAPTPEEALRADTPPAPCPQCGWSTMWNE
jgi:predicted RNA-binding Zn-ribbon protein involved in translation (DUF1610 family)